MILNDIESRKAARTRCGADWERNALGNKATENPFQRLVSRTNKVINWRKEME